MCKPCWNEGARWVGKPDQGLLQPMEDGGAVDDGNHTVEPQERATAEDGGVSADPMEEGRRPMVRKAPHQPTAQEIIEHSKTHIPFRTWCVHCMRGKAKTSPHSQSKCDESVQTKPVISLDYAFLGIKRGGTLEEKPVRRRLRRRPDTPHAW